MVYLLQSDSDLVSEVISVVFDKLGHTGVAACRCNAVYCLQSR